MTCLLFVSQFSRQILQTKKCLFLYYLLLLKKKIYISNRETDRQRQTHTIQPIYRQTGRQRYRQTDSKRKRRQTDRLTNKHILIHKKYHFD